MTSHAGWGVRKHVTRRPRHVGARPTRRRRSRGNGASSLRVCGHMVKVQTPARWRLVSARVGAFCDEPMSTFGSSRFSSSHPPVHPASRVWSIANGHGEPPHTRLVGTLHRDGRADRTRGKATRAGSQGTRQSPGSGTLQAHGIITAHRVVASPTHGITTAQLSLQGLTDT